LIFGKILKLFFILRFHEDYDVVALAAAAVVATIFFHRFLIV